LGSSKGTYLKQLHVVLLTVTTAILAGSFFAFSSNNSKKSTTDQVVAAPQVNKTPVLAQKQKESATLASSFLDSEKKASNNVIRLSSAMSTLDPPSRPVHELLEIYKRKNPPNTQDDLEIFSALSYCANQSFSASSLRDEVARGELPEKIDETKKHVNHYAAICGRLGPTDFAIRSSIARKRADSGDVDAMLQFLHIGPAGKWPNPGDPPISAEQVKSWERDAMQYLQSAASKGSANALLALSDTYLGPGGVPCISEANSKELAITQGHAFASQKNPVMSLAYTYAYQSAANLSSAGKTAFASVIPRYEACLSADERQRAKQIAELVVKRCCLKSESM
jgi:hypothetical protein